MRLPKFAVVLRSLLAKNDFKLTHYQWWAFSNPTRHHPKPALFSPNANPRIRMLNIVDEFTREALAIRVARRLNSTDVIDVLSDLFILHGVPAHIRSDNGPEFIAKAVQTWIAAVGAQTVYITPGSPWENGYIESFNARLRERVRHLCR
jgi:transposase InsO family protein